MAREKAPLPNAAPADDKKRAIDTAMAQIERMYGKGAIMRFGDKAELNVDYIPTGSLSLDVALGIGGLPKGRIVEIYGPESSGKTTLALHVVAEAQKRGGEVAFVDAEHALDPTYARALGVDIDSLLVTGDDNKFAGMVWLQDLIGIDQYSSPISSFLSDDYLSVRVDDSLSTVLEKVADYGEKDFGILPVLDAEGAIRGFLNRSSLLSTLIRRFIDEPVERDEQEGA